jgi:hypothetical protein
MEILLLHPEESNIDANLEANLEYKPFRVPRALALFEKNLLIILSRQYNCNPRPKRQPRKDVDGA